MYLYTRDLQEAKYQSLLSIRESTELKYLNDSKAFIEYSIDMDDIYKNIEEYNPNKKGKILIIFYDLMADMLSNKNLSNINCIIHYRKKIKYFSCFYYLMQQTILL